MASGDAMTVAPEAPHMSANAAPRLEAAALDAELAVDVDPPARIGAQQLEEPAGESRVVRRVIAAPGPLAEAAVQILAVVMGDGVATTATTPLSVL